MVRTINALLRECRNRWHIGVDHENPQADLHLQGREVRRDKALSSGRYRPDNHQKIIARMRRLVVTAAPTERRASTRGMVRKPRAEDSGVVGYSDAAAAVLAALPTN